MGEGCTAMVILNCNKMITKLLQISNKYDRLIK